jgi:hypothetical protein
MHLAERRTSSFPSLRKLRSRRHLPANQTRQSTAIRVSVTPSLGIMGTHLMPRRQRSPTGGQANFYINNCDERADGVHISYDRMASLLAPYGNPDALEVARNLDAKLEDLLQKAQAAVSTEGSPRAQAPVNLGGGI